MPRYLRTMWDRDKALVFGLVAVSAMMLAAFFAPLPYDPVKPNADGVLLPPSWTHLFGTDRSGFDVLSRTIASAGRDLPLALAGTLVSLLIGVPLGILAGTRGRWGEFALRALDVFQAFPLLVLAIVVVTLTGNRVENVVFAIAMINAPRLVRLVHSEVLPLRETRFIEAALAIGASPLRIMFRHILPNVTSITLVQASLCAANAIVVVASLSFFGVGVTPPEATWGAMLQTGAPYVTVGKWWVVVFPGLAVFVAVICLNMIADGLSIATDAANRS